MSKKGIKILKSIPFLSLKSQYTNCLSLVTLRTCNTLLLSTTLSCLFNSKLNRWHGVANLALLCLERFVSYPKSLAVRKAVLPCMRLNTPWDSNLALTKEIKCLGSLFIPNTRLTFSRQYSINNNNCQGKI